MDFYTSSGEKYTFDQASNSFIRGSGNFIGEKVPYAQAGSDITSGYSLAVQKAANPNQSIATTLSTGEKGYVNPDGTFTSGAGTNQPAIDAAIANGGQTPISQTNGNFVQPITNPITPPSTTSTTPAPTLPTPQAGNTAATYQASLASQIETAKTAVQAEADKRAADYQTQIDALKKEQQDAQAKMDAGLTGIDTATQQTLQAKQDALTLEKQRFDENYNANQALIGEMDSLLTTGNQLIEEMKGTTGLSSIMNPRIAKTMSDVQARAGVIQAVLSARNGQMSYAQQQLGTTYDALSSMLTDQTNYYKTVISFYDSQKTDAANKALSLTKDQKDYLDVKLNLLNQDLTKLQATKDIISKAMLDPSTATQYAMAGVTMNDSPEQIAQKLSQYAYSQELKDKSNAMETNGYSRTPQSGVQPTYITDSQGNQTAWYKIQSNTPSSTSIVNVDGRQKLINDVTGTVIQDLGASATGTPAKTVQEVSAGASLIDTTTGKIVATAPTAAQQNAGTTGGYTQADIDQLNANRAAAAKLGIDLPKTWPDSPTAGTSSGTVLTTVGFPPNTTQTDITAIDTALKTGMVGSQKIGNPVGSDGYIDPANYVSLMNYWISKGGTKAAFLSKYPVKTYINPANTWVWSQIGIANPFVKTTTTTTSTSNPY